MNKTIKCKKCNGMGQISISGFGVSECPRCSGDGHIEIDTTTKKEKEKARKLVNSIKF